MRSSSARCINASLSWRYAPAVILDQNRSTRRLTSSAAALPVRQASAMPRTGLRCLRCWLRTRTPTTPAPAAVPMAAAATGRTQLRGSRIDRNSQDSSSSAARSVSSCSVVSRRMERLSGGSTGLNAWRSRPSMSAAAWSLMSAHASACGDDLLELLDRTMYKHLGRAVGAPHCPRDLPIVHTQREAHDERFAAVVRKLLDPDEDPGQLVAPLHQVLGRVHRAERARVLDRRLGLARPVAIEVRREVVRDADQPWPQRAAVGLPQRPLVVAIGLQEGLLGQVLGVVVIANPVVGVGVDVPKVRSVELRELLIELRLVHASEPTQAAGL